MDENKKEKKMSKAKKIVMITMVSVLGAVLTISLVFFLIIYGYINKMNLESPNDSDDFVIDESALLEPDDTSLDDSPLDEIERIDNRILENANNNDGPYHDTDVLNILLIGTDNRASNERGRSDAMILVSINKKTESIIMTSILRDIYLDIPGLANNNRLNAAYAYGGTDMLVKTIEQNFKIKIDKYARVDFDAFVDAIDAVGGIEINLTNEEVKYMTNKGAVLKPTGNGSYKLDGKQALMYARIRYIGTDFGRTARQRTILNKLFVKARGLNPIQMNGLLNKILPMVTTDFNEREIFTQIISAPAYLKFDVQQGCIPMEGTYENLRIRKMQVLGIDFEKNIQALHGKIYGVN